MKKIEFSTLQKCFRSHKRIAIFAGAGISFNSGIPTVPSIIEKITSMLPFHKNDAAIVLNQKFPFEAFMQTIKVVVPIEGLLEVFNLGKPNHTHHLIAEFVKRGKIKLIVTTNFDVLLEEALHERKITFRKMFISRELETAKKIKDSLIVFKLHGSVEDTQNLGITLEQVAARKASLAAKNILSQLFYSSDHTAIVFLGYSCSDYFDINPELENCARTKKKVYYVNHSKSSLLYYEPIDTIGAFKEFISGVAITANTDTIVTYLSGKKVKKSPIDIPSFRKEWEIILEQWAKKTLLKNKGIDALITCGRLMVFTGYYQRALKYYTQASTIAMDEYLSEKLAKIFSYTAQVYRHLGDYKSAVSSFEDALVYWKKTRSWSNYAKTLSDIGSTYRLMQDFTQSRTFQRKALRIFKRLKDKKEIRICLIIIGNSFVDEGNHQGALDVFKEAVRIHPAKADKQSEVILLNSLAAASIKLKNLPDALQYLTRAADINKDLKVKRIAIAIEYNFGCYYETTGNLRIAVKRFTNAHKLAVATSDATQRFVILKNRCDIYERLKKYKLAFADAHSCIDLAKEISSMKKTEVKKFQIVLYRLKRFITKLN